MKQKKQNIKINSLIFIIILSIISSCGIFKKGNISKVVDEEYDNSLIEENKVKTTLDSIQDNYPNFKTFYSGFTGNYESGNQKLPLKGIIKINVDTFILISVRPVMGIEMSGILITQDSIKFIDKIKKEYFLEEFSIIKKKFGFDLNFKTIQSIMLNRFFVFPPNNETSSYYLLNIENSSTLSATGIFSNMNLSHKTNFSSKNFSIYQNEITLLDKNQNLKIIYSDFNLLNNKKFPSSIILEIYEKNLKSKINISYKNIKINEKLNIRFVIPENYKNIKFE